MVDNGGAGRRTARRWLWIIAGIAAAGAVCAVVGIWHLPARMYPDAGDADARAALQSGLLTAAAALTAVAGGLIALDETRQANAEVRRANAEVRRANENTHVRELYVEAVKLLNDTERGIRLAGIYALERIAVDSPADQRTVVEVLSAFVRDRSTDPALRLPPTPGEDGTVPPVRAVADIRAAVQVLARLPVRKGIPRSDLTGATLTGPASLAHLTLTNANLTGARLDGADLAGVRLDGASLTGAVLLGATLTLASLDGSDLTDAGLDGASLTHAHLNRADLTGATLNGADLTWAQLNGADLTRAQLNVDVSLTHASLRGATLTGAELSGASLTSATLDGTDLTDATLDGADLTDATLNGADLTRASLFLATLTGASLDGATLTHARLGCATLTGAFGLSQGQVDATQGDERTRLPEGLVRPASWPPEEPPDGG
ncbi:pentapeptide repeat protein [Parafrankia sp. EAN1pec]|uniref:pentapeptide repeat-containing protein n=1 Tax=Parafrankia sp. (strain EAN1pec) TaxID=298653 RepID=UPI00005421EF|nr:pentapeptide repeat protein [Frankia sp. EAN1pec]